MRTFLCISIVLLFSGCLKSESEPASESPPPVSMLSEEKEAPRKEVKPDPYKDWENNNGIGPVDSLTFNQPVNREWVALGKEKYDDYCLYCHKEAEDFVGPPMKDIFKRRTPAWTMNMILNPQQMILEDPIAKQLFIDYNAAPMGKQDISREEARAMLEYFRTID